MHQIMTTCFHSVRQKLHRRSGTFDLLGFDFLIDDDFKVRLSHRLDKVLQITTSTINTMNQLELNVVCKMYQALNQPRS